MPEKKALITGITGQDGSYLAELLLTKGYEVHGMIRRSSSFNTGRIMHLFQEIQRPGARLFLHYGDLTDGSTLARHIRHIAPQEIYNLGAQSHVRTSFDIPEYTTDTVAMGTLRLLEAIRETGISTKFYQASSSEMFGNAGAPQSEKTPLEAVSPYGIAKVFAHQATVQYRKTYGLFAVSGILFNHESPRRGETFVTRKITRFLARALAGKAERLYLGNLDAKRDWGYAPEYVEAIWRMMQHSEPKDFVIATGKTHTVREFLDVTFRLVGLDWEKYVEFDQRYLRPQEVDVLQGDASLAERELQWQPQTSFHDLARKMVYADLEIEGLEPDQLIRE